jgi:hypothetical protein
MSGQSPINITTRIEPAIWITSTPLPTPELLFGIFLQALEVNDASHQD